MLFFRYRSPRFLTEAGFSMKQTGPVDGIIMTETCPGKIVGEVRLFAMAGAGGI